jgi:threonylcarbamoyladenosine tRNA methylthiotransferase MtaB
MSETSDRAGSQAPRAALHSLGCRLNHAETALLHRRLEEAGYRIVPWGEEAELCVLNSCTVTMQSGAKSRQALGAIRRRFPGARLAIVGCYAQMDAELLAARGLADLIIGNAEKLRLVAYLPALEGREAPLVVRPPIPRASFRLEADGATGASTRAHLKVQDGCDFMCSFCIIPFARGRARPRAWDDLLREAEGLAAAGAKELVLTGVNLGTYLNTYQGRGRTLVDVTDALSGLPGIARVRVSSIEPTTVEEGLLERMADPAHRLAPFLHLPLQSGSARVLAAMRRRYDPAMYRVFAEHALDRVPDLCLGTDVMAGFPGEDAAAFAETVALLEALPCAYFHVFPYSPRQGTPATRMPAPVPAAEKQRRVSALRWLSDRKRLEFQRRFVGRTLDVLFERPKSAVLAQGYTANYLRVEVPTADPAAWRNRIAPVRLMAAGDPARPEAMSGKMGGEAIPAAPVPIPA